VHRASSCTLCDEKERKQAQSKPKSTFASAPASSAQTKPEMFHGEIVAGAYESWIAGRELGQGAFAQVRLAKGLKTGRIVGIPGSLPHEIRNRALT